MNDTVFKKENSSDEQYEPKNNHSNLYNSSINLGSLPPLNASKQFNNENKEIMTSFTETEKSFEIPVNSNKVDQQTNQLNISEVKKGTTFRFNDTQENQDPKIQLTEVKKKDDIIKKISESDSK